MFAFETQYSSCRLKARGPEALGFVGVQRLAANSCVKFPISPDSVMKYCTASKAPWKNAVKSNFFISPPPSTIGRDPGRAVTHEGIHMALPESNRGSPTRKDIVDPDHAHSGEEGYRNAATGVARLFTKRPGGLKPDEVQDSPQEANAET